jgi:hypothetical protein
MYRMTSGDGSGGIRTTFTPCPAHYPLLHFAPNGNRIGLLNRVSLSVIRIRIYFFDTLYTILFLMSRKPGREKLTLILTHRYLITYSVKYVYVKLVDNKLNILKMCIIRKNK